MGQCQSSSHYHIKDRNVSIPALAATSSSESDEEITREKITNDEQYQWFELQYDAMGCPKFHRPEEEDDNDDAFASRWLHSRRLYDEFGLLSVDDSSYCSDEFDDDSLQYSHTTTQSSKNLRGCAESPGDALFAIEFKTKSSRQVTFPGDEGNDIDVLNTSYEIGSDTSTVSSLSIPDTQPSARDRSFLKKCMSKGKRWKNKEHDEESRDENSYDIGLVAEWDEIRSNVELSYVPNFSFHSKSLKDKSSWFVDSSELKEEGAYKGDYQRRYISTPATSSSTTPRPQIKPIVNYNSKRRDSSAYTTAISSFKKSFLSSMLCDID